MAEQDFSDRYNTKLSPDDEAKFQAWAKAHGRERDSYDYDLRGAWKADAKEAGNGHLPDTWKKPNHPTFSDESQYNGAEGAEGGHWQQGKDGKWSYTASRTNLDMHGREGLDAYFKEREPDSTLIVPDKADHDHEFRRAAKGGQ